MTTSPVADPSDVDGPLPDVPTRRATGVRERVAGHALATDIARIHGDALLRTARRHSTCADDALDAYQRAMERLLEHAGTIDRTKAVAWMHVVVRREAGTLRRQHGRTVPLDGEDVDVVLHRMASLPDEQIHAIDRAQRAGEALATLKESEAQALCLRAQGMSYEEIADAYGWSYTKVNRAVSEGRKAFAAHYRAVESGTICGVTADQLARFLAGELRPPAALKVRAHLARCPGCRAQLHLHRDADTALRALLPPVFVGAAAGRGSGMTGWLHDHVLGPIGHAAGRLQPTADHLLGSKLGVAAASTVVLAGSGIAVERKVTHTPAPPPQLRATIAAPGPATRLASSTTKAPSSPLVRVVDGAVEQGQATQARVRNAAIATARRQRAATRRKKARAKARRAANAREFATGTAEFDSTTRASSRRATAAAAGSSAPTAGAASSGSTGGGGGSSSTASAPTASAPPTEVPTGASTDSSVEVVTESAPSSSSGGGAAGEFGD